MAYIEKRTTAQGPRDDVCWRMPDGKKRKRTFNLRKDADNYLKKLGADELAGLVIDPNSGEVPFGPYAERWIETRLAKGRPLSPSTRQGYQALLRRNLQPHFKSTPLRAMTPEVVRGWHSEVMENAGQDQAAKSYRLLRAILGTAVDDRRIGLNPCLVRGAGIERTKERPMVDVATVVALSDAIDRRLRALVILGAFGGLRTGEMLALTRADIDVMHREVHVRKGEQEIIGQGRIVGDPKSEAGIRTVVVPRLVAEALEAHLATYAQLGPDGIVFTAPRGGPLRRTHLSESWRAAVAKVPGAPDVLHIHDLRHHALTTMARMPGITTKELMARAGHSSPRAALIYQHHTEERDRAIADFLDREIEAAKTAGEAAQHASVTPLHGS